MMRSATAALKLSELSGRMALNGLVTLKVRSPDFGSWAHSGTLSFGGPPALW